jgi:stage IV sporulation protein FA
MDVRNQVRLRRQERMRQITERGQEPRQPLRYELREEPQPTELRNRKAVMLEEDHRLQDPEYAWKHRDSLRSLNSWSVRPDSGDDELSEPGPYRWMKPPTMRSIRSKVLISGILFGLIWSMFKLSSPWAEEGQRYITEAMTKDMNFAAVQAWYSTVFSGAPSMLPAFRGAQPLPEVERVSSELNAHFLPPVAGKIMEPFNNTVQVVRIVAEPNASVSAIAAGRVIESVSSVEPGGGSMIRIQHNQGYETLYSGVAGTKLQKNDWVQRGERLGAVVSTPGSSKGVLTFAIQKDDRYINPADVIPFD